MQGLDTGTQGLNVNQGLDTQGLDNVNLIQYGNAGAGNLNIHDNLDAYNNTTGNMHGNITGSNETDYGDDPIAEVDNQLLGGGFSTFTQFAE